MAHCVPSSWLEGYHPGYIVNGRSNTLHGHTRSLIVRPRYVQVYLDARHCDKLGIQKLNTTTYHPQCNGLVERFNRILKTMLRNQVTTYGTSFIRHPIGILNTPHEATGKKPSSLLFDKLLYVIRGSFPCSIRANWRVHWLQTGTGHITIIYKTRSSQEH